MKVSVSLPDDDIEFLDQVAKTKGYESRSAVIHKAVRLLRASELAGDYTAAWDEWIESGDAENWDTAVSDGLAPG